MKQKHTVTAKLLAAGLALSLVTAGCGSDSDDADGDTTSTAVDGTTTTVSGSAKVELDLSDDDATAVATTYADLVYANYDSVVAVATTLQTDIDAFVAAPSEETLETAKQTWLDARDMYGPTEAFRFYDGPIDNAEDGPEGQINAWPLDESYIDYVEGDATAGIVNNTADFPDITTEVLVAANEEGGETNISTGWHAIEFLLWGQDLSEDGPGARPVTDYTTAENAGRRGTYLSLLAHLLVEDLTSVRDQWDPENGEYRTAFIGDPQVAVSNILTAMGTLSSGELAGERMAVAYEAKDQEDEHSCFSDNTLADIVGNAKGVRMVYTAEYEGIEGTSLASVIEKLDADTNTALLEQLDANVAAAEALEGPFDQIIVAADDAPEREQLLALITDLQAQGDAVAGLANQLGFEITITV